MNFPTDLQTEIDYRLDLYRETCEAEAALPPTGDPVIDNDVPLTGDALMYQTLTDIADSPVSCPRWNALIMDWYLEKGVYAVMSDAEYDATTIFGGRRAKSSYFPRHRGGQRVQFMRRLA